jgi:hypothetical protein
MNFRNARRLAESLETAESQGAAVSYGAPARRAAALRIALAS